MCIVESARKSTVQNAGKFGYGWRTVGGMITHWESVPKTMKR